jgi:hypothetical protein
VVGSHKNDPFFEQWSRRLMMQIWDAFAQQANCDVVFSQPLAEPASKWQDNGLVFPIAPLKDRAVHATDRRGVVFGASNF